MLNDVVEQEAAAARKGLGLLDCPYLKADAMPAHTGEPIHAWRQRVEAWERGWNRAMAERADPRDQQSTTNIESGTEPSAMLERRVW